MVFVYVIAALDRGLLFPESKSHRIMLGTRDPQRRPGLRVQI